MTLSYRTYERGQLVKIFATFINFDGSIPTSIVNPTITIQRWDEDDLIDVITAAELIQMEANKYVFEWQLTDDQTLDTYIVSYNATVDGIIVNESINVIITTDSRRPSAPDGVTSVFVEAEDTIDPEDPNKPTGLTATSN